MNEAIAKLEAHLKGGGRVEPYPPYAIWRENDTIVGPATDPATAEGREWWCEALPLIVTLAPGDSLLWEACTAGYVYGTGIKGGIRASSHSRTEAIIAAIEAAAEAHAKGAPPAR